MKLFGRLISSLSVLSILISCTSTYERNGDSAYDQAKKLAEGDQKRLQQKTAYIMYQKAIKTHPDKINNRLRARYIEMTLIRANMVLNEGSAHMDAIPLYMEDIDSMLTGDVPADLKQQYALFLAQLSDSAAVQEKYDRAISFLDKAITVASDVGPLQDKRNQMTTRVAKENFEMAKMEFTQGKASKDPEALIRAEYHVLFTLLFDPKYPEAEKFLSDLRKENRNTYSAYIRVIENIPDSSYFRKVNKYDILLAVPTVSQKGGSADLQVTLYNYSYNPLRMKSEHFFLVDAEGNKFQAAVSKIEPEILDQEHETKFKLHFPKAPSNIVKLIYENGDHLSEKFFM